MEGFHFHPPEMDRRPSKGTFVYACYLDFHEELPTVKKSITYRI